MKNVNTFFKAERLDAPTDPGRSITLPGLSIDLADVLQNGNVESLSENMRKRMIFGEKRALTDLTDLDYYRGKIIHYESIFQQKINSEKAKVEVKEEVVEEQPENNEVVN